MPIIAQVFGHTASKRRHCSAFELKNQVIKTFVSLLKFSFNVAGESLKLVLSILNIAVTDRPKLPRCWKLPQMIVELIVFLVINISFIIYITDIFVTSISKY